MKRAVTIPLLCGVIALTVSVTATLVVISQQNWRVSALVRMASTDPIARLASESDANFAFVPSSEHYDGVYFYAIAEDPLARDEAHTLIDESAYRYGHAGYGWLAWLVSLRDPAFIPGALLFLGLLGVTVAAIATSLIARQLGWTPWAGLFAAFSPGLVSSVISDTAEPVGIAVVALAVLFWLRGRIGWSAVFLVAACLIKEPFVLVPVALALWDGVRWLRGTRPSHVVARVLALAAGPVAFGAWYAYLRVDFGLWPYRASVGLFGPPVAGWVDTLKRAVGLATDFNGAQLSAVVVPLLVVVAAALIAGAVRALRVRSPLDVVYLLFFLLAALLNWWTLLYPKDLIRELVVPLLLLPAVFATLPARALGVSADRDAAPRGSS